MKRTTLLIVLLLILYTGAATAQCDAPTVEYWQLTSPQTGSINDQTFEIGIVVPEGAEEYQLTVYSQYAITGLNPNPFIHLEQNGDVTAGANVIEVTVPPGSIQAMGNENTWHYFSADLQVQCTDGSLSGAQKFYLSSHSMLNDPGFQCDGSFYNVVLPLPDGQAVGYEALLPVEPSGQDEVVDSLEVFVDIGHTYAGDIEIELESPSGTVIILHDGGVSSLGGSFGFSVLFKDGAPEIENLGDGAGPRGIFMPYEALSAFTNEPTAGVWKITIYDLFGIDDGMLGGVCLSINGSPCIASLSGTVFYDLNNNAELDGDDVALPYPMIENTLDDNSFFGNGMGTFLDCSSAGSGAIELMNTPNYYTATPASFDVIEADVETGLNIPLQGIPGYFDLEIDLFAPSPDVPGFSNTYYVTYQNVGTECIDNPSVLVTFPENMTVISTSEPGALISDHEVNWVSETICPTESGTFTIDVLLSDTSQLDDLLEIYALIEPMLTDETPHNNEDTFESIVVGAFDPNDKLVDESAVGPQFVENNESLKYTVRFQNTGTYYAQNVVIIDTLESQLDLTSFELLGSSHPVEVSFQNNVAFFTFNNIMLPDSTTDLEGSKGFVRFSLEPTADFSPGDVIENQADIYFDFNPPIITNTATTLYDISLGMEEKSHLANAWPNPAHDQVVIRWPHVANVQHLEVYDAAGRLVRNVAASGASQLVINTSDLRHGVYTIRFQSDQLVSPLRLVKQ